MGLPNRTPLGLLCQLIMRDNPQIQIPLDPNSVVVLSGPFTTNLGNSGRNTRIILNGRGGAGLMGKREFFYDRMNIGALFNGITVVFDAAGSSKTVADLLPALNEQYGLGLGPTDITNGATKLPFGYAPTPVTLTISTTCVAYTGSLSVSWKRKPVGTFPDSGPGTKVMLIGDLTEGYFGTVSEAELFSGGTILAKLNEGRDIPYGALLAPPATRLWYKFARDNKIFYLASYNQINIRWQELYRLGSMYETDDPAAKQFPPDGVKIPQTKVLKKTENGRDWYLSPCTPRLSSQDPWDYVATTSAPDATGDVARLFAKITNAGGFSTGEWDVQGLDQNGFWMRNTSANTPANRFGAGMVGTNVGMFDGASYIGAYRPFLELVDPNKVTMPLDLFAGNPEGVLRKPMVSISSEVTGVLLSLSNMKWETEGGLRKPLMAMSSQPLVTTINYTANKEPSRTPVTAIRAEPLLNVKQTIWAFPLRKPLVSVSSTYVSPYNLQNANGELDGFN